MTDKSGLMLVMLGIYLFGLVIGVFIGFVWWG